MKRRQKLHEMKWGVLGVGVWGGGGGRSRALAGSHQHKPTYSVCYLTGAAPVLVGTVLHGDVAVGADRGARASHVLALARLAVGLAAVRRAPSRTER